MSVKKKKSIKLNYIYNLFYEILVILIPLVTTPYISRTLSVEGVGTYSYTYSIVVYFTVFAVLGTKSYAIRRIAERQDDRKAATIAFWEVFLLRVITSSISIFIYYAYVYFYAENKLAALAQSIYIWAVIFDISWFFQGLEEFKRIIIRNVFVKFFTLLFIFAFVKDDEDLLVYILGLSILTIVGNASIWVYLPQYLVKVSIKDINPFRNFREVMVLFIPNIAIQIYTVLDKTMIGIIAPNMTENGYYEQAEKIVKAALTVITSLSVVMLPRISNKYSDNDKSAVKRYMEQSYRFVFLLSCPMMFGLFALSDLIVPWFLGVEYSKCISLINVLSILFISIGLNNITGVQYLVGTKRQNVYAVTIVGGAVINFCLNMLLIPYYYSLGAAIASVIAETMIAVMQLIYVYRKDKMLDLGKIGKNAVRYFIAAIIMFGVLFILKIKLDSTFIDTMVGLFAGGIVYFAVLLLMRDELVMDLLKKSLVRISKKK